MRGGLRRLRRPRGLIQGKLHARWGNLHSHPSHSDGAGTPDEAFDHAARAGLDFQDVTDHREGLETAEWAACRSQANTAHRPGTFVAGRG